MSYIFDTLGNLAAQTALGTLTAGNFLMIAVACGFMYLAIAGNPFATLSLSLGVVQNSVSLLWLGRNREFGTTGRTDGRLDINSSGTVRALLAAACGNWSLLLRIVWTAVGTVLWHILAGHLCLVRLLGSVPVAFNQPDDPDNN